MADRDRPQAALRAFAATMAGDYELTDVLLDVCDHVTAVLGARHRQVTVRSVAQAVVDDGPELLRRSER